MATDHDLDLAILFDQSPTPADDETFVRRVSKGIALRRHLRWGFRAALAVLAIMTALLTSLSGVIATWSNLFAQIVTSLFLTPAGWVICVSAGLFFFLRTR